MKRTAKHSLVDTGAGDDAQQQSLGQRLKAIDDARPDFPGEHLIVFGLGALLMVAGMRGRTVLRRALFTAAGTALVGRAASGTGGISKIARLIRTVR
ncbi:hypothetical protein RAS12_07240 [Achromobacter seleniivolatilans]|uniref:Transmembrane protein n=1 Tax=Achromobacter seleniivolatilans TaxID=3047478 RepID=A0ABY9M594_9BURK|nr:hypothetical protein [Achromobacter sp. R39]WMD22164.1 hypothetical protein RAS12_07240 [Achromobacter sp. R39]